MRYDSRASEGITASILRFRDFLNDAWPALDAIFDEHDWDNDPYMLKDWLDDNWNHLFVRQILGKGYKIQPLSVSIIEIKKQPYKYLLHVDKPSQAIFLQLGTNNNGFSISPPFDQVQVLTIKDEVVIVPLSEVKFSLIENN